MGAYPFNANSKLTTIAGQVSKAKQISANYVLDPELDYDILVDASGGTVQITLPLGVDGQEFYVQDATGSAGANNITFLPTAPNIIVQPTPTINSNFGSRRWIFKEVTIPGPVTFGVWYFEQDSSAGGTPTGDPNTGAYFDGSGNLNSNTDFGFADGQNSMFFGVTSDGGSLQSGNSGSLAIGRAQTAGIITSNGLGSFAHGNVISDGAISATNDGATANGESADAGSSILASGFGSQARGSVTNGAIIQSTGAGSYAQGVGDGASSLISAEQPGAVAQGNTTAGATINATNIGSEASGLANGALCVISASGIGAKAYGFAQDGSCQIVSAGNGSLAMGGVGNTATIIAGSGITSNGSLAYGGADQAGSTITSGANGSEAAGYATNGGQIIAGANGSKAWGLCDQASSLIQCNSEGAIASGYAVAAGTITATAIGAQAWGVVSGTSCQILASGSASSAFGYATSTGIPSTITATGNGAHAFGSATDGGTISAAEGALAFGDADSDGAVAGTQIYSGGASLSFGVAIDGGQINSSGANLAFGDSLGAGAIIQVQEAGSFAGGSGSGIIEAIGGTSFAHGYSENTGQPHRASGRRSAVFGESNVNGVTHCFATGRFAKIVGDPITWTDTEPLFVIGNGPSVGSEANAFQIRKDGLPGLTATITPAGTTGAQTINKASGTVNIAALGTSVVVTNSLVDANSIVLCVLRTNDLTAVIKNVVPAGGSFTINLTAAATGEVSIGFVVVGQAD